MGRKKGTDDLVTFFFEEGLQEEESSKSLSQGFKVGSKVVKLNPLNFKYDSLNLNNGGQLNTSSEWFSKSENKAEIVMTTYHSHTDKQNWFLINKNIFRGLVKLEGYVTDNEGNKYEFDELYGVVELFFYRG